MQIEYRSGDFIDGPEHLIIHGSNALGVMGSGAAKAIKERTPYAYGAYRQAYLLNGLPLGSVIWAINTAEYTRPRIVGNAITQGEYGSTGQQYVNYEAIAEAIDEVDRFVTLTHGDKPIIDVKLFGKITEVAMPKIGAGLGGGDWNVIQKIIAEHSRHFMPIVYTL